MRNSWFSCIPLNECFFFFHSQRCKSWFLALWIFSSRILSYLFWPFQMDYVHDTTIFIHQNGLGERPDLSNPWRDGLQYEFFGSDSLKNELPDLARISETLLVVADCTGVNRHQYILFIITLSIASLILDSVFFGRYPDEGYAGHPFWRLIGVSELCRRSVSKSKQSLTCLIATVFNHLQDFYKFYFRTKMKSNGLFPIRVFNLE